MAKKFLNDVAVIELKARTSDDWEHDVEAFDLGSCLDLFARCEGGMSYEAVEARFDELWRSGEIVTVDGFKKGAQA
ncbi:MAG: hypothetical protein EOM01_12340 [Spirochaetia bacterium]|nr:hypothetical protein [Spirochaetia bacterium]